MLNITEKSEGEAAKDYVLRQLIYNIVHTNLLPGQKLEAPELCSLMNVSNNPLREAELELAQSKLIEIKPKIGKCISNAVMKKRFSHLIKNFTEVCIKCVTKLYGTTL